MGARPGSDMSLTGTSLPRALIRPRSTEEVAAALRLCNAAGVPVIAQGGMTLLTDPETGEHVLVDTGDVEFRSRLWELAQARQRQLEAVAAHAGIALHPVSTDEDLVGALLRMARLRSKWRR